MYFYSSDNVPTCYARLIIEVQNRSILWNIKDKSYYRRHASEICPYVFYFISYTKRNVLDNILVHE